MPFSPLRPTVAQWCVLAAAMMGFAYVLLGLGGGRAGQLTLTGLEYLEDAQESLTVDDLAALPDARWKSRSKVGFAPASPPHHLVWARVRLRNSERSDLHGVLMDTEHYADRVECFTRDNGAGGGWSQQVSGEWTPARDKAIWGRENAFPITVPAASETTLYLRYEDTFSVWLQSTWWPRQEDFYAAQLRETLGEGLYFGTLLALLFYNAILWVKLRLPPTGSYLLYLGSFTLFMFFARSGPQLLGWALGSPWMESLLTAFLAASGIFLLSFVEGFLDLPLRLPKALRWVRGLRNLMIALAIGSLFVPWFGWRQFLTIPGFAGLLAHLVVFGLAVAARRAGAAQGSYVMLAIGALFAGLAPVIFYWLDILPIPDASRVIMAGSATEMLLLAILMSDRIGLLQQEKIAAQKALLLEAEQRETMQEAYADDLALEVRERTAELESSNADKDRILAVLGHDLRSPLTGLTRSAEHWDGRQVEDAALRGFISEAVQTGRSLLLLIEDLVMWARLRAGTRQVAIHPLGALVSPVLALHRFQAQAAGIALEIRMPDDLVVKTDLVPVQALLRNLLANALRVARHSVSVEAIQASESIQISVRDDGQGLPEPLAAAFNQEDHAQLPNTHGLGLRLCKEISRALGLRLQAVSSSPSGTEFRFHLPTAQL